MSIVYGFGGFRLKECGIHFAPILPRKWTGYKFRISYRDSKILVHITNEKCRFILEQGDKKTITVYGKEYLLKSTLNISMPKPKEGEKQ